MEAAISPALLLFFLRIVPFLLLLLKDLDATVAGIVDDDNDGKDGDDDVATTAVSPCNDGNDDDDDFKAKK
jgi:hypothetical protein